MPASRTPHYEKTDDTNRETSRSLQYPCGSARVCASRWPDACGEWIGSAPAFSCASREVAPLGVAPRSSTAVKGGCQEVCAVWNGDTRVMAMNTCKEQDRAITLGKGVGTSEAIEDVHEKVSQVHKPRPSDAWRPDCSALFLEQKLPGSRRSSRGPL